MEDNVLLLREKEPIADKYHKIFERNHIPAFSLPVLSFCYHGIEELKEFLQSSHEYSGLVLTSKRAFNALEIAAEKVGVLLGDALSDSKIYVVGPSTEICAQGVGLNTVGSGTGNADELAALIVSRRHFHESLPLVFPCGNLACETIPKTLRQAKIALKTITCYSTTPSDLFFTDFQSFITKNSPKFIVFFSPSGAQFFLYDIKKLYPEPFEIVAIGKTTANAIDKMGYTVSAVARKPNPESLLEAVKSLL